MNNPAPLFTLPGPVDAGSLSLSTDGRYAVVMDMRFDDSDHSFEDWTRFDLRERTSCLTTTSDEGLRAIQPSADGRRLRAFDDSGDLPVLCEVDFETLAVCERLPWSDLGEVAPDGSALVARPSSEVLVCVDRSGEVRWRQIDRSYGGWVRSWWLSPSCLVVASEWKGRKLSVLDAATGAILQRQLTHKTPEGYTLSPSGDRLVGGPRFYIDVLSGEILPRKLLSKIFSVAFSPDGVFLAASTGAGTILLLTDDAQRLVTRFECGGARAQLAWSPDGQRLVTFSSETGQLAVWDVASLVPGVTIGTAPATTIEASVRASVGKASTKPAEASAKTTPKAGKKPAPKATKVAAKAPKKAAAKGSKAVATKGKPAAKKAPAKR